MKTIILAMALVLQVGNAHAAAQNSETLTYGIHLFFDEKGFVDVLTLKSNSDGTVEGTMHVPNDFDGKVENLVLGTNSVSFDLFVPKNLGRPNDLVFHYDGRFFDSSRKQIIGFVELKGDTQFLASFTGFLR